MSESILQETLQQDTIEIITDAQTYDWFSLIDKTLWHMIVPIASVIAMVVAFKVIQAYLSTLWVAGKADEWVIVMNNGKMQQAGIGLKCFKGPFDQVATFPARTHKVTFKSEQVTKEMAGIAIEGMLVWSINRVGEGPLNAYKNLGADLASDNPHSANDALTSMASAIVRSCIANSTIQEMLTNRKLLRDAIRSEMFEVVKGWGVWLETVEITGVTISSQSLFKDMQTNYRESVRQEAETYKMEMKSELAEIINQNTIMMNQKERDFADKKRVYQEKVQNEINDAHEKYLLEDQAVNKRRKELELELEIFKKDEQVKLNQQIRELDLQINLASNECSIQKKKEDVKLDDSVRESEMITLKKDFERKKLRNDHDNNLELLDLQLEKANMDQLMLNHHALEKAKSSLAHKYISKASVTSFDKNDVSGSVLAGILNKLDMTKKAIGQK